MPFTDLDLHRHWYELGAYFRQNVYSRQVIRKEVQAWFKAAICTRVEWKMQLQFKVYKWHRMSINTWVIYQIANSQKNYQTPRWQNNVHFKYYESAYGRYINNLSNMNMLLKKSFLNGFVKSCSFEFKVCAIKVTYESKW